jgi:hypothetical protein
VDSLCGYCCEPLQCTGNRLVIYLIGRMEPQSSVGCQPQECMARETENIKEGTSMGSDGIPIEIWRYLGNIDITD